MAAIGHTLLYPKSEKISIFRKSEYFCQMYDTHLKKINAKIIVSTLGRSLPLAYLSNLVPVMKP
jgi:hypothetical protein